MNLNFNSMRYAVELARQGSFSRAAGQLYISQPALSKSISSLEKQLGIRLFTRGQGPVKPTRAGEVFLRYAQEMTSAAAQMETDLARLLSHRQNAVRIGVPAYYEFSQISTAVRQFHRLYPHVLVSIQESFSPKELETLLSSGEVDFVVRPGIYREGARGIIQLSREKLYLAVPREFDRLLGTRPDAAPLSLEALALLGGLPLIVLPPQVPHYKNSISYCQEAGFTPKNILVASNISRVRDMADAGMGMAFLYSAFLPAGRDGFSPVQFYECSFDLPPRSILACCTEDRPAFLVQQFLEILKESFL